MSKFNRKSLFVATGSLTAMLAFAAYHTASAQVGATPPPTPAATPGATPPAVTPAATAPVVPLPPLAGQIGPVKVGFINMGKLLSNNKQLVADRARFQNAVNNMQITAAADKIAMKKLEDARNLLTAGTAQYDAATDEMQKKSLQLQMEQKLDEVSLQRDQSKSLKGAYDSISAATKAVATAKGLDLILVDNGEDLPADTGDRTPEQVEQIMFSHQIMYASSAIDVTGNVAAQIDLAAKPH
jgi:Skp family chaperone for outer membrane proteins